MRVDFLKAEREKDILFPEPFNIALIKMHIWIPITTHLSQKEKT